MFGMFLWIGRTLTNAACRVQNGNCEWSWLCQVQCQASCDRCHKVPPSLHKLHPFAGLVGFQHVADIMQRKVDVVMHSEEIFKSHAQVCAYSDNTSHQDASVHHEPLPMKSKRVAEGCDMTNL